MHSLRKWFYRPKKEDSSKLALFYWADEELTMVATELDSFDGRTDPDRCSILVSQLRICQDKVLSICNDIMDDAIPDMRANRDFRAKFPDDVLHENLAGQLWFGAECLAAGSNIIHRELESASMRPLAKALTRSLDNVRCLLREQSLKNTPTYSDKVRDALRTFDRLFAEFELCYVSAMVPIKTAKEYHLQQEIVVLFSETLIRALKIGLVTQDMIDDYDPSLMFTIPRLAIIWGLLLYPDGPFNVEKDSAKLSELFRPFCNLLFKIRDLLWTLTETELHTLEKMLCSQEEPKNDGKFSINNEFNLKVPEDKISQYYKKHLDYKQFIHDFYAYNFGILVPESGVPEHSEEVLVPQNQKYPVFLNKSEKCQNDNHELDNVEFRQPCNDRKSPDFSDSDIETVVSDDFRMPNFEDRFCDDQSRMFQFCNDSSIANEQDNNKDSDGNMSDDDFRTRVRHSIHRLSNDINFSERQREEKELADNCAICASERLTLQHDSCYDSNVSRLHNDCACSMDCSREHLSPSREIMRQVMGQVEIVPHGQPIIGYTSSVENSSRAYHHGLLSHSYPSHSGNNQDRSSHSRSKRLLNHRSMKNRVLHKERDMSTSRCYNQNANSSCWNSNPCYSSPLMIPRIQHLRMEVDLVSNSESTYSSCSSCQSISSVSSPEWESPSPDTSSYNSECQDDEEIALALQAAEISTRNKARSRFKSSRDLLHKLFVCVSGVADQLQTNYASDLRNILKSVFDMNCSQIQEPEKCVNCSTLGCNGEMHTDSPFVEGILNENAPDLNDLTGTLLNNNMGDDDERDRSSVDSAEEVVPDNAPIPPLVISTVGQENENNRNFQSGPPEWMPDELSANCMACTIQFTILRRRHHCRNCGKIFCSRCSSNSIPLPRYGHLKPVRVCNQCFMYQLTNLVMQRQL